MLATSPSPGIFPLPFSLAVRPVSGRGRRTPFRPGTRPSVPLEPRVTVPIRPPAGACFFPPLPPVLPLGETRSVFTGYLGRDRGTILYRGSSVGDTEGL